MAKYLANAFSLSMLSMPDDWAAVDVSVTSLEGARKWTQMNDPYSVVGHSDTAGIFSNLLKLPVACNRTSIVLNHGDEVLVGQYQGPRLPEGATQLPEGSSIRWMLVTSAML